MCALLACPKPSVPQAMGNSRTLQYPSTEPAEPNAPQGLEIDHVDGSALV
jgi:hypothetical protein